MTLAICLLLVADLSFGQRVIGQAQGVKVTASVIESMPEDQQFTGLKSVSENSIKIYKRTEDDGLELRTYDNSLELKSAEKLPSKATDDKKEKAYRFPIALNGKLYMFKFLLNKNDNVVVVDCLGESGNELEWSKELFTLDEANFYNNDIYPHPKLMRTADDSKLLFNLRLRAHDGGDPALYTHRYIMFDKDMKELWRRDMKYDAEHGPQRLESERPGDDGAVYAITRIDKGRDFPTESRFDNGLYRINGEEVVKAMIPARKKVMPIRSFVNNGTRILMCGYGERASEGWLMIEWDGTSDAVVTEVPFTLEHMIKKESEKTVKKLTKQSEKGDPFIFDSFYVDGIEQEKDGGLLIYGQERWGSETMTNKGIHVFRLDKEFKLKWTQKIPVNQLTSGIHTAGAGYVLKRFKNKLYVIFNDSYNNIDGKWVEGSGDPDRFGGLDNPVVLVSFDLTDPDNTYKRTMLWDSKEVMALFNPDYFYSPEGANYAVTYVRRPGIKASQCVLRLEFEE